MSGRPPTSSDRKYPAGLVIKGGEIESNSILYEASKKSIFRHRIWSKTAENAFVI